MKMHYKRSDVEILIKEHEPIRSILVSKDDYDYLLEEFDFIGKIEKLGDYWFKTKYGFSVQQDSNEEDYYIR